MENIFIIAFLVTLFFTAFKFFESKYLEKEEKPLKVIVRDAIIVFVCSVASGVIYFNCEEYIRDFFNAVTETKVLNANNTQIFTDAPGF
jgi:RsiW-degrading membrane proteinase PrsW (M82 family)